MRFVMKLVGLVLLTLGVQIGYETIHLTMINVDAMYGVDTRHVDAAIHREHKLNACNSMTRQAVACVLTIPLPGDNDD